MNRSPDILVEPNVPQFAFLQMRKKFRAFVAGFGCMRGDTLIVTEHGPLPIAHITRPMRVLSWSATNSRFELALSGGAFPKGRGRLYRIVTQQGEFVASEHHRVFCADGKYRLVRDLRAGQALHASSPGRTPTIAAHSPRSLHAGAHDLMRTAVDSMGRYADAARQYGQRFLSAADGALEHAPSQDDAPAPDRQPRVDDLAAPARARIRQDRPNGRQCKNDSSAHVAHLASGSARDALSASFAQSWANTRAPSQSPSTNECHQQAPGCVLSANRAEPCPGSCARALAPCGSAEAAARCLNCSRAPALSDRTMSTGSPSPEFAAVDQSYSHSLSETRIVSVAQLDEYEPFYDLQVLDTNNYVSVDGTIHHNSGKTFVGAIAQCAHHLEHPGVTQGYFAPTFPHIRDIFYPTVTEVAEMHGMRVRIVDSNKEVHFYRGRRYYGTTICRSMDNPDTIVGFKIGRALVDEIDVLKEEKAQRAWRKIVARLRVKSPGVLNGIDVTTTPEGFKFTYKQWVEEVMRKPDTAQFYGLVRASTYDNEANLPDDYIPSLLASYPAHLIKAYLNGEFTNLTTGTVYRAFDRARNLTTERIQDGEALHIGMDFNVGKMAAIVHVIRKGRPYALAEITKRLDTPDMIVAIKEKFPGRIISVYPDASGAARKTNNASESDISQLRGAGFNVVVNASNPAVKDRVNAMNACFERGYWVNAATCPDYVEGLEKQPYNEKGEPDKSGGYDHGNDAGGYFIVKIYPIAFNRIITTPIQGR